MRQFTVKLLLPAILAVLLAVSQTQNAFGAIEIAYDDGVWVGSALNTYLGVRFTVSYPAKIVGIRVYVEQPESGTGYITGPDHTTVLLSFPVALSGTGWPGSTVPISGGPTVSGDFFVIVSGFTIYRDAVNDYSRSYAGSTMAGMVPFSSGDFLIRVLVDPVSVGRPVGGFLTSMNKLTILAPYLALVGLVGLVGTVTVVAAAKRRCKP